MFIEPILLFWFISRPDGVRFRISTLKGWCPNLLDDRAFCGGCRIRLSPAFLHKEKCSYYWTISPALPLGPLKGFIVFFVTCTGRGVGFEPTTRGTTIRCSANWTTHAMFCDCVFLHQILQRRFRGRLSGRLTWEIRPAPNLSSWFGRHIIHDDWRLRAVSSRTVAPYPPYPSPTPE